MTRSVFSFVDSSTGCAAQQIIPSCFLIAQQQTGMFTTKFTESLSIYMYTVSQKTSKIIPVITTSNFHKI